MDILDKVARSKNMAAIKSKDTKPEIFFRSLLHSMGYRYSLHKKDLPGRPDLFLKKYSAVIFVHGCFWHQHSHCEDASYPKSNTKFWVNKLQGNIIRDQMNLKKMRRLGYKTMIIWECEINKKNIKRLERKINNFLN